MLRTMLRTLTFSNLKPSALQNRSASLRCLLWAIDNGTIESAYIWPPSRATLLCLGGWGRRLKLGTGRPLRRPDQAR